LKRSRFLMLMAVVVLAAGTAMADSGGDGQPKLGAGGPGSPDCSSFQGAADPTGAINADCTVSGSTATTIIFAVPDALSSPNPNTLGLTCSAPQLTAIGWTQNANQQVAINGTLVDECSFTAPTASQVTGWDIANAVLLSVLDSTGNCNCNWTNFITGIPVGCDITVTTNGDKLSQLFAPNAAFDVAPTVTDLVPFPEPGTLWFVAIGLAGLMVYRRKCAEVRT